MPRLSKTLEKFSRKPSPVLRSAMMLCAFLVLSMAGNTPVHAAADVPMEAKMPGTQPEDGVGLESPDKCDNCHQGSGVNIAHDWRGSMMSHAGRDPIFWATLAIAEQDFDGAGDICIRCHMHSGWEAGHSTPTDGSTLSNAEGAEGVGCDVCHKMTNTDNGEWLGVQNPPFVANDGGNPAEGYYGSAQLSLWSVNTEKLGPYADAQPKHKFKQSLFHRDGDFCGSCHDVSNPVVGDLAPNNGAQQPLDPGDFDGQLNTADNPRNIEDKAAFNNPPYQYGVVERTFSEYKAGLLWQTLVSSYAGLPTELQAGQIQIAHDAAVGDGSNPNAPNYVDGAPRYFSCQTCHMQATKALGCNKPGIPTRADQPMHDLTGGNYWMPLAIQYMDTQNTLRLGTGLSPAEIAGLNDGISRAMSTLNNAASLSVNGNTLHIVNLTGHKLISGYPEGRRMWINIKWYDDSDTLLREDGQYGALNLSYDIDGIPGNDSVMTLLDLNDPNTKIYEAHGAITQDWAAKLIAVSSSYSTVPVAYDRTTGAVEATVQDIANMPNPDDYRETFHFVLNNRVAKDNRIPPYGMSYDESIKRNILPVPAAQYGNPDPGGTYNYYDDFVMNPPTGATHADIALIYQPTSWEYIQFLATANNGASSFLGNEGANLLDAWLHTGMATPHTMATTTWAAPDTDGDGIIDSLDNCPNDPNPDQLNNDGDSLGDVCDPDDDNDGLDDTTEASLGTNPFLYDTDGDTLGDGDEVSAGTSPLLKDTDGDGYDDNVDPIPLDYNYADGDVAPYGSPDMQTNTADLLVGLQLVVGIKPVTNLEKAHMDLYPVGAPDGEITISDYLLLQKMIWFQ